MNNQVEGQGIYFHFNFVELICPGLFHFQIDFQFQRKFISNIPQHFFIINIINHDNESIINDIDGNEYRYLYFSSENVSN